MAKKTTSGQKTAKKTTKKTSSKTKKTQESTFVEEKTKQTSGAIYLLIAIIAVAAILLGLIYGPRLFNKDEYSVNYNGFLFEHTEDGYWTVHVAINDVPYSILFHYHPSELEGIPVQEGATVPVENMAKLSAQGLPAEIYLSMDPKGEGAFVMAGVEIAKVTGEKFGMYNIPTKAAYSKNIDGNVDNVPVITCNDADEDTVVIWIKEKGDNLIALPQANCIVLQGTTPDDTIKVADRFIYELFGIM